MGLRMELSTATLMTLSLVPAIVMASFLPVNGSATDGKHLLATARARSRSTTDREALSQFAVSGMTASNGAFDWTRPRRRMLTEAAKALVDDQDGLRDVLSIKRTDLASLVGREMLSSGDGELVVRDVLVKNDPIKLGRRGGTTDGALRGSHSRHLSQHCSYYCCKFGWPGCCDLSCP